MTSYSAAQDRTDLLRAAEQAGLSDGRYGYSFSSGDLEGEYYRAYQNAYDLGRGDRNRSPDIYLTEAWATIPEPQGEPK